MKTLYLLFLLLVVGCSTTGPATTVNADIPVAVVVKPADVVRPTLTSDKLQNEENDTFVKALETDLTLMKNYVTSLEKIVDEYKKGVK